MKPIKFKEVNIVFQMPLSLTNKNVDQTLPAYADPARAQIISCWKLTIWESIQVAFTGRIWLWMLSRNSLPPVSIITHSPFISPREAKLQKAVAEAFVFCALRAVKILKGISGFFKMKRSNRMSPLHPEHPANHKKYRFEVFETGRDRKPPDINQASS
jgi:hypothetical protein